MWLFPDTELGRLMHRHLVERPVRWTADASRTDILYLIAVVVVCLSAGEMVAMFGSDFLAAYAWGLTLYLDGLAVSFVVATAARFRSFTRLFRIPNLRGRQATRPQRTRRSRRRAVPKPGNDDVGERRRAA